MGNLHWCQWSYSTFIKFINLTELILEAASYNEKERLLQMHRGLLNVPCCFSFSFFKGLWSIWAFRVSHPLNSVAVKTSFLYVSKEGEYFLCCEWGKI